MCYTHKVQRVYALQLISVFLRVVIFSFLKKLYETNTSVRLRI